MSYTGAGYPGDFRCTIRGSASTSALQQRQGLGRSNSTGRMAEMNGRSNRKIWQIQLKDVFQVFNFLSSSVFFSVFRFRLALFIVVYHSRFAMLLSVKVPRNETQFNLWLANGRALEQCKPMIPSP